MFTNKLKSIFAAAIVTVALPFSFSASADVIGFDGLGSTGAFTGIAIEGDFTLDFDSMFVGGGSTSTPALEIERLFGTSGFLTVTRTDGGLFTFDSIDWEVEESANTADILLEGFLGAAMVGSDLFTTSTEGYTTFSATGLAGVSVDSLVIRAERSSGALGAFDTLVVGGASEIPAPATLALFGLGLIGLGRSRRK